MMRAIAFMVIFILTAAGCGSKRPDHLDAAKTQALEAYADCILRNLSKGRLWKDHTAGPGEYALDLNGIDCAKPFPSDCKVLAKIVGSPTSVQGIYFRIHGWDSMISVLIKSTPSDMFNTPGYQLNRISDRSFLVKRSDPGAGGVDHQTIKTKKKDAPYRSQGPSPEELDR